MGVFGSGQYVAQGHVKCEVIVYLYDSRVKRPWTFSVFSHVCQLVPPPHEALVEEKRAILTVEAADRRAGGYTRIFPCKESYKYRSLFEEPRHLNDVLGDYFANGKRSPHKGLRNGNDDRGDRAFSYKY